MCLWLVTVTLITWHKTVSEITNLANPLSKRKQLAHCSFFFNYYVTVEKNLAKLLVRVGAPGCIGGRRRVNQPLLLGTRPGHRSKIPVPFRRGERGKTTLYILAL